tara:strand:- start:10577 stop:12661 length:2085 start_codon:yes stop_codon:yes gene_type:complete
MTKKVLLKAPILTASGYGVHARTVYRALASRPDLFDIYIDPLRWGHTSWLWEDSEERRTIDKLIAKTHMYAQKKGKYDVAFHVTIPNEFEKLAPLTIGCTAGIESSKVSAQWLEKINNTVNKVIAVSEFGMRGIQNTVYSSQNQQTGQKSILKLNKPISFVNYPVLKYKEVDLGLEFKSDFNFLVVSQWGPRKNIENTIKWFIEQFHEDDVGLVLKVSKVNNSIMDRERSTAELKKVLDKYPDRKCHIHMIHGYMNNDEIHSLYLHDQVKAFINLSHGEGYGLPIFEAAYCGVPIVTHAWGGQTDFLYCDIKKKNGTTKRKGLFSKVDYKLQPVQEKAVWPGVVEKDSSWAFPIEMSYKDKLREVHKDYGRHLKMAKQLKKHVLENFTEQKIYDGFIEQVFGEVPKKKEMKYVVVSDMFANQFQGGAEFTLESLLSKCHDGFAKVNCDQLTESMIEEYKDKTWVFGNITKLNPEFFGKFKDINYSILECDYKLCKYRNPQLHLTMEGKPCDCAETEHGKNIKSFYEGADHVFYMAEKQMKLCEDSFDLERANGLVLSSVFDGAFFGIIEDLRQKNKDKKSDVWLIPGSSYWVKGTEAAEKWCKENGKKYEKLINLSYMQTLEKLAQAEGLCCLPAGEDTCPRLVIEAKLLGCELVLNDFVIHKDEPWFDTNKIEEIEEYLKSAPEMFWGRVSSH